MNKINLSNQAKAFLGVGLLGTSLIVGGVLYERPNKCESIVIEYTDVTELATEYVEVSDNLIQLSGLLQPIMTQMNQYNLDLKKNDCRGEVSEKYQQPFVEAQKEYKETLKTRYPFMTNWL